MSLAENSVAGAALASLELHRSMIMLLIRHGVLPPEVTIGMIDLALQTVEKLQMGFENANRSDEAAQYQAARFHISVLQRQLDQMKAELSKIRDQ